MLLSTKVNTFKNVYCKWTAFIVQCFLQTQILSRNDICVEFVSCDTHLHIYLCSTVLSYVAKQNSMFVLLLHHTKCSRAYVIYGYVYVYSHSFVENCFCCAVDPIFSPPNA